MARINIDGEQNVEVSIKIPCEKSYSEQLEIMEAYTKVHKDNKSKNKAIREVECLKVLFPPYILVNFIVRVKPLTYK